MRLFRPRRSPVLLAFAAIAALLLQTVWAAGARAEVTAIEICSSHGGVETIFLKSDPAQTPAQTAPCQHCEHCVLAPPALTPAPALVARVRYETAPVAFAAPIAAPTAKARAPPRPPGQGPPILSIA